MPRRPRKNPPRTLETAKLIVADLEKGIAEKEAELKTLRARAAEAEKELKRLSILTLAGRLPPKAVADALDAAADALEKGWTPQREERYEAKLRAYQHACPHPFVVGAVIHTNCDCRDGCRVKDHYRHHEDRACLICGFHDRLWDYERDFKVLTETSDRAHLPLEKPFEIKGLAQELESDPDRIAAHFLEHQAKVILKR